MNKKEVETVKSLIESGVLTFVALKEQSGLPEERLISCLDWLKATGYCTYSVGGRSGKKQGLVYRN